MIAVFILMIIESIGSKKTKFLYFDTPNHCRLVNEYVKEGKATIGKKEFKLGDSRPKLIRQGTLFRVFKPFYILRWNHPYPYEFDETNLQINLTPESAKLLSRNTTLETLLKGGGGSMPWLWLIIGVVIGVLIGYMLISTGLIPVTLPPVNATATA